MTKKRLSMQLNFECKCGEKDTTKFILKTTNSPYRFVILCCMCERQYEIRVLSKELSMHQGI